MTFNIEVNHPLFIEYKDLLYSRFAEDEISSIPEYIAIYIRVSSDKQAIYGTSLIDQIIACLNRIIELEIPIEKVRIYHEGIDFGGGESGEDIDRPEMNRLRNDADRGFIKKIIATHPDRFSRDLNGKLQACSTFTRNEVDLNFIDAEYKNTPEGHLFFNMLSSIAQYELEQIKRRTRKGIIKAVSEKKKIQPMRVSPYGYELIDGRFIKIEKEVEFVQKIYQWYVEDELTMREIGEKLYEEGAIPKRQESEYWNQSTIARILKNENYIGRYYYNRKKTKKIKGERTKKGKIKKTYSTRNKEEWLIIEDEAVVPKIISIEMFYKAQAKRLENWKEKGQIKHNYLLNRKINCACCGVKFSPYTSQSQQVSKKTNETKKWYYKRYRCTNKNPRKYGKDIKKCPLPILHAELFENFIWEQFIINSICNIELLEKTIMAKENESHDPKLEELQRLEKRYSELEDERKTVIKQNQKGWITEEEADKEMDRIINEQNSFQLKIDKIRKENNSKTNLKQTKEQIIQSAIKISELLKNNEELPFELKKKIIDLLIEEIFISEGKKENEIKVKVLGIINEEEVFKVINKILSNPCLQPQVILNKSDVVNITISQSYKSSNSKALLNNSAYIEYIAKINYLTESGKNTVLKFRKSKFAIN